MSLRIKTASSIRWTALNASSIAVIQLIQLAMLGRLLGPGAFGLMAMLMVVIEIARVFSQMGLSEAIIAKRETNREHLSSLFWINILAGSLLYGILMLAAPVIAAFFREPQIKGMLQVVGLIFIISAFSLQFEALIRKNLFFDLLTKINITAAILGMGVAVGMAVQGFGVWSLIYGQLALHTAKTAALVGVAIKRHWFPTFHFRFKEIEGHFFFGLNRVGAMAANQINSRMDQMVIGSLLGPVPLGFYNIAFRIVIQPIQSVNPILTQVAFPVFSQIQYDDARLKRGFVRMVHLLMSINAPLLLGICALAPLAIPFLMGEQWRPSVPLVQVLAFYALLRSLGNAGGSLILAKGMASWTLYWNLALLALIPSSVLLAVAIKKSVLLVSLVLAILQAVLLFAHYFFFLRRLVGPFAGMYVQAIGKPILAAGGMALAVYFSQFFLNQVPPVINLLLSIFLGAVIYLTLSFFIQRSLFHEYWEVFPVRAQEKILKICRFGRP
ncbi:MAG: MOP flippase family protein [Desulfobacterales bacterium]|nr:MOP flippase family protein [Desulfobacterales bacterium]